MSSGRTLAQEQLRLAFSGLTGGFTTYAFGFLISFIIFITIFGPLYSLVSLFDLFAVSANYPLALGQFLLELYIISFFALPLGMAFRILWERRDDNTIRNYTTAIVGAAAIFGLRIFDAGAAGSLLIFSSVLIWLLWRRSYAWDETVRAPFTFRRALIVLYCTFFAILFVAFTQPLSTYTQVEIFMNFIPTVLLPIQGTSLILAVLAAPALWLLADHRKPRTIWFAFAGLALLAIVTLRRDFIAGSVLIGFAALLYYRYNAETVESYGEFSRILGSKNPASSQSSDPLQVISTSLNKLAHEAEFLREVRTGEVLRIKRREPYLLQLERKVSIDGFEKTIGVNHYLVSSRTGHGKTTLVRNLARYYREYGFLIMDRHDEHEGQTFQLNKEFDQEKFETVLAQLPASSLSSGSNILREAQVFNIEQQFERLIRDSIRPKMVEELYQRLQRGGRVLLRPGTFTDFTYTRVCHAIIGAILEMAKERKREGGSPLRIIVVNEEAQNSFNVDEYGEERERNHTLLRVVHEGRKYGLAIVNITSNPESVPRTVKDNSILVLGSIGTPAIKRLVGEKLGTVYVRHIYELPIGDFFLDLVDEEANYIVFPDHFGVPEFIDAIKA